MDRKKTSKVRYPVDKNYDVHCIGLNQSRLRISIIRS